MPKTRAQSKASREAGAGAGNQSTSTGPPSLEPMEPNPTTGEEQPNRGGRSRDPSDARSTNSRRTSVSTILRSARRAELEAELEIARIRTEQAEADIRRRLELQRLQLEDELSQRGAGSQRSRSNNESVISSAQHGSVNRTGSNEALPPRDPSVELDNFPRRENPGNLVPLPCRRIRSWVDEASRRTHQPDELSELGSRATTPSSPDDDMVRFAEVMGATLGNALQNIRVRSENSEDELEQKQNRARKFMSRDLPVFSGDPATWANFITQYRRTTTACGLSSDENLCRLEKALRGKARESIQALLVSPTNVDTIIQQLEQEFGQPRIVVKHLLEKARKVPACKESAPQSISELDNAVNSLVVTMLALNYTSDLHSTMLVTELADKLSPSLQLQWGKRICQQGSQNLLDFSQWLLEEKAAVVAISTPEFSEDRKAKDYGKSGDQRKSATRKRDSESVHATAETPTADQSETNAETGKSENRNQTANQTSESGKKNCACCDNPAHSVINCPKFAELPMNGRWNIVKRNSLCFSCLKRGHGMRTCRKKGKCTRDGCERFHHHLLHKPITTAPSSTTEVVSVQSEAPTLRKVLLKILPVKLYGPKSVISTFALLDDASTVTLVDAQLSAQLGLKGPTAPLVTCGTGAQSTTDSTSQQVSMEISGDFPSARKFKLLNARTMHGLSLPRQVTEVRQLTTEWPHLRGLKILESMDATPRILIGQDNWSLITSQRMVRGPWYGPALSKTPLGWVLHGRASHETIQERMQSVNFTYKSDATASDSLQKLVQSHWELEACPTSYSTQTLSKEDKKAIQMLDANVRRCGDRWQSCLLWRNEDASLPDSYPTAIQRLYSLENKMKRQPDFAKAYESKLQEFESKGYIRKLSTEEIDRKSDREWYLPHFAVQNPNKPNKLRIVFDAATKVEGKSLNDYLMPGPDLYNPLPALLINFRLYPFAFAADIKEMFLQILMRPEDQPAQRILWRGVEGKGPVQVYQIQRVFFGANCSPCLAQDAKNRNAEDFAHEMPEAVHDIIKRHYMDDYLGGTYSEAEAVNRVRQVVKIHKAGGFQICNWVTNTPALQAALEPELLAHSGDRQLLQKDGIERVLGVAWSVDDDAFRFQNKWHRVPASCRQLDYHPTKREVLQIVMSVFDPLGFVAYKTVQSKIFLQQLWRAKIGWDDKIPMELLPVWKEVTLGLSRLTEVHFPRWYSPLMSANSKIELQIFCDASADAYAAVAYLRILNHDQVDVSFVMAKTRVAPTKPLSIPRLELQAAVLASRLYATIKEHLDFPIEKTIIWSDSQIVLHWLRAEARRFQVFVANRISEIDELTEGAEWRWVPTEDNVADEATKQREETVSPSARWFRGPPFLRLPESEWPRGTDQSKLEFPNEELEVRKKFIAVTATEGSISAPDVRRFSLWPRLLRSTAWMLRFIHNCRNRDRVRGNLSVSELKAAEHLQLKIAQNEMFSHELAVFQKGDKLPKSSRLYLLTPFLSDDGLLRVYGRFGSNSGIDSNARQPVILAPKHPTTRLIAEHYHRRLHHQGREALVNELRQSYWIIGVRNMIRKMVAECRICQLKKLQPVPPLMADLPLCRMKETPRPFYECGVDFFGPILVTVRRFREKRYGVLFTCMAVRAIHLEVATDLSTDSFLLVLSMFASRRGWPRRIYSDNGTNFQGADRVLREHLQKLDTSEIRNYCTLRECEWHFNSPNAPHMGGAWERLIRSVKGVLMTLLKQRAPPESVLRTLLAEVEITVNSRPLTHVSIDPTEPEALTPNHFLLGSSNAIAIPGCYVNHDTLSIRHWVAAQTFADHFWQRWRKEYLPTILLRSKWQQATTPLKIGDVVLLVDYNQPRNTWPRGVISAVYPTEGGQVRTVDVRTATGIMRRSTRQLIKLKTEKPEE